MDKFESFPLCIADAAARTITFYVREGIRGGLDAAGNRLAVSFAETDDAKHIFATALDCVIEGKDARWERLGVLPPISDL